MNLRYRMTSYYSESINLSLDIVEAVIQKTSGAHAPTM